MFISFEGIDGSGKSTQARLLAEALRADGREVVLTREPGGSAGAEQIRRLLVEGRTDRWSPETELLLFTAARRDHLERTIRPALDRGAWVVTDRFADSTRVYQGVARADLAQTVEDLHRLLIGLEPDRTFVIDLDPDTALDRATGRAISPAAEPAPPFVAPEDVRGMGDANGILPAERAGVAPATLDPAREASAEDRFEAMGLGFQQRLRDGFRALARAHPKRVRLIDGRGPTDAVAARVRAAL